MNNKRQITIYSSRQNYEFPQLILQGKWLMELGFNKGDLVTVELIDKKLVIEKIGTYKDKK